MIGFSMPLFEVSRPFPSVSIVKLALKVPDRPVKPARSCLQSVAVAAWAAEVGR